VVFEDVGGDEAGSVGAGVAGVSFHSARSSQ
jgi:hypothetical protein